MKTVRLLFYPLENSYNIKMQEDELTVNFDELLIKNLYFPDLTTPAQIEIEMQRLQSFGVVWVDSWTIKDDNPEE